MKKPERTVFFKCAVCGKLTTGRMPRAHGRHLGDGSFRYPRRHNVGGEPCEGNLEEAIWIDTKRKDKKLINNKD